MKELYPTKSVSDPEIPKLFLRPDQAAEATQMCRSTLERNLYPHGARIPYFRIGTRLFFQVSALEGWGKLQIAKQQREADQGKTLEGAADE